MHRALQIIIQGFDMEHTNSRTIRENYVGLLQAMGKTEDETKENVTSLLRQG